LVEGDSSSDPSAQKDKAEQKNLRKSIFLIISTLKANLFFNRSSQKCFVKTPWFLVMGPKNSGKSSAIQNADLDLPILDDFLQRTLLKLQETSETKWSFFKQGVFIEIIPSQEKEALPVALIKNRSSQFLQSFKKDDGVSDKNHVFSG
jgi:type VI protein secretion system component VasK